MTRRQEKYAVAIIGMAGRFPGADTVEELWKNLCEGADCLHISTDEDLKESGVPGWQRQHPDFVRVNGVVEGAAEFDAPFFGFSAHDASIVDPQHRVFLECAWEAFEDAGYDPLQSGEGVGVFAGAGTNTYRRQDLGPETDTATMLQLMVGSEKDFLATRVAYKLNLTGPAITLQTACSTSLVAVQMAYESLRSGTSSMAIAGGVSIMFPQKTGYIYQPGMILSPDGYCRAFDASAAGTTIGRGAGAVLLKPLEAATRDGDHIYAVIQGAAINNDGASKGGYTAPGVKGQTEVIKTAMAMAAFEPGTVHYVEAHGTGTEIGDSIEIAALAEAFAGSKLPAASCTVSSLKASIGHLDAAAGVANLIKAAMAVRARVLPGTLHYTRPNPELHLEQTPFRISSQAVPYTGAAAMRAGVSAFGIGGTNVHVCLEEWEPEKDSGKTASREHGLREPRPVARLFPLSAHTGVALEAQRARLADHLEAHPEQSLADVAYTLQRGRKLFSHRYFAVATGREQLVAELRKPEMGKGQNLVTAARDPDVFFIFPGQGAQYVNMGRGLYESDAVFHDVIDQCAAVLEPLIGLDLRTILFPPPGEEEAAAATLKQTRITQPALFSLEYALAMRLMAAGVRPSALLGHSLGEYVAATVAGVFKIEHILAIIAERGRMVQSIPPGSMLAVSMPEADLVAQLPAGLSVAAVNAPRQTIVSGPTEAIQAFAAALGRQRIACAALPTSHAFHSAMLDPIAGTTAATVARFPRAVPGIPLVSNLTGKWITGEEATDPAYYDAHLRQTVRFADGLALLTSTGAGVIVEAGPGETLLPLARAATKGMKGIQLVSTTRRASSLATDDEHWLHAMGQLWLAGVALDWEKMHGGRPRRVSLPTYPFDRQRYWIDDAWGLSKTGSAVDGPPEKQEDRARWLYTPSWQSTPPPAAPAAAATPQHWLIFAEAEDTTLESVRHQLAEEHLVTTVVSALAFSHGADNAYTLDPGQPEHYAELFHALEAAGMWPGHIVYALEQNAGDSSPSACYARLFHLAEALQRSGKAAGMRLSVITSDAYDIFREGCCNPANRAAAWLAEVMAIEITGLEPRVLQRDRALPAAEMAQRLLAELVSGSSDPLIVLRGRNRWTPGWMPLPLAPRVPSPLRDRGTYLVTGGFGGIGLVLAEYLATRAAAHLVLVSRSAFAPQLQWPALSIDETVSTAIREKAQLLLRILAAGGTVEIEQADVQDAGRMQQVVAAANSTAGGLRGIIHSAGVVDGTVIGITEPGAVQRIFAAKAEGTEWIKEAVAGGGLDFVLLCSSLSAVIPSVGLATYGGSNAFLDGFAAAHDNPSGTRVLSVNWDNWSEVGMAVDAAALTKKRSAGARAVDLGISNAEGAAIFELALGSPVSQLAVSTQDLPRLIARVRASAKKQYAGGIQAAHASEAAHPRPELTLEYVAPRSDAERAVVEIWQELLGIDRVGVHDDFFELGGHSLLGAQFISRIRERFRVDIPLRTIFETPTPAACAQLVAAKLDAPPAVPASRVMLDDAERVEIEI